MIPNCDAELQRHNAVLRAHVQLEAEGAPGSFGLVDPRTGRLGHLLALITIVLVVQAAALPGGIMLLAAVSPDQTTIAAPWWLLTTLLGAPLAMTALTALPARASTRRPIAESLRSELARPHRGVTMVYLMTTLEQPAHIGRSASR
ncbi:MAG: hypothetical protein WAL22_01045 [Solirubrobacteraceae bacterium]